MKTFPASAALGQAIRRQRMVRGFTYQSQLATALGWSTSTLSRLESGRRGIYPRDVIPLAGLLDVDPSWFGDPGAAAPSDQLTRAELLDLRTLIEEQGRTVQALIELVGSDGARGRLPL